MKIGNLVTHSEKEPHLDGDVWVEVYPEGNFEDMAMTHKIAKADKTYRNTPVKSGQSPLLVRRSALAELKLEIPIENIIGKVEEEKQERSDAK